MITLKYCKQDALKYVSHIDLLRHMERTLRRADLPVKFSQGYNPHMLVNLGITLPLGVGSVCEYVTVDVDCDAHAFLAKYNAACPSCLRGLRAWAVEKNPNLAGTVVAADYRFAMSLGDKASVLEGIAKRDSYVIAYPGKKDENAQKDIAPLLYGLKADADGFDVRMAAGNVTVRPQALAEAVIKEFALPSAGVTVSRLAQYIRTKDGVLMDADDMLDDLSKEKADV